MHYFRRIWPSILMTASFSLIFLGFYLSSTVRILEVIAGILLGVTLWLGFIYIVNEARFYLPKPLRTTIRWLHAMSFEVIIVLLAQFVFRPIMRLFGTPKAVGATDGVPILLIHGYLWDWTGWVYIRWKLKRAGFGPIYVVDLGNVMGSIHDYAKDIAELAERISQETKRPEIILIGHSMGGLVASTYATQLAPAGKVKAVIVIGSPLSGTQMAHIGFIGKSVKEMLPDSEFVQKIQQSMESHPEIQLYQAMSQADELIVPNLSAVADNHFDRHYIVDDIGHMTLLFSSRIANRICSWVKIVCGQQGADSSKSLKSG